METTKFINKEMALMAATTAYIAAVRTGHYADLHGGEQVGMFTIYVHLELDELFTLPSGYEYSGVEERKETSPLLKCPPFKYKKYYFEF